MKASFHLTIPAINKRCGFTLIELLVSIAILMLVLAMVGQIISSASLVTNAGNKRMDADGQARQILDRMSIDFARMVKRPDVDFFYQPYQTPLSSVTNDQIAFYSETIGYFPTTGGGNANEKSSVSLVGYMITTNTKTNQPQLVRLSKGLAWNGVANSSTMVYGTNGGPGYLLSSKWPNFKDGSDTDYQVLGNQVYRLEFAFLKKDGTITSGTSASTMSLKDISAIIVAIAILDKTSWKIVTNPSKLASALPYVTLDNKKVTGTDPQLMASVWNATINATNFAKNNEIPQAAASQIRVYQRFFYLNSQ
ncbi:MAG: prepilin-type N-terminal cleavage/methylation domain-containing protein [Verrucomicrobiota bacterium]